MANQKKMVFLYLQEKSVHFHPVALFVPLGKNGAETVRLKADGENGKEAVLFVPLEQKHFEGMCFIY
ncbi:hypothetical protein GO013_03585 [Pseudodesulfovibrio sp. JC047]|uniref:hypothetical protein n=1 Tax=Pseudodesulfovibrio sp. JC047 TaxID=2683199 RepID=UPI0013D634BB|nr:hypothetical protein [Pseudodesulfovibrio sp. JC047]NDV18499.1 hypothetical protein [Pseudodesulfovibrio sp. JC047]